MTHIKKISMSGFKSFGDRTVTIRLSSGFTCIVGPNGAGKSNIIDALCFALGRLSKKTMRAKSLEDLIFAGSRGKNPSQRASVTLYFDNSENVFPGGTTDFEITRTIKRGGGGGYKMNGKKATRQQILNALAAANIDPDGSNQFVLQGKIVELTHMSTEDRRVFIEELIGLQKYDEMKDATLKELEKAERDLGQFEAIFKEVSTQLKKVEKEKNDALAWKELDEQINFLNSQLIALKISKLREEEDELERKIETSLKIIEELQEKINRQEDVLKQESLVMDNIQTSIIEKEKEREEINENITQIKTQISSSQTTLNLAKKSIEKLNGEIESLESKQMKLEEGQTFDILIEAVVNEISENENLIEEAKKEIEKRQQNQAELDINIKNTDDEKSLFKAEISKIQQSVSSNNAQIKVLRGNIEKNEEKKEKLENELQKLKGDEESIDEAIKATKKTESDIRNRINNLNTKISKENQNQKELEDNINSIQIEKNQLHSQLTNLQANLSSLSTEIKMNQDSILELNEKKTSIEKKIVDLSKGKDAEKAVKELLNKNENVNKQLTELKAKLKQENSVYRKNEQDLELLNLKKYSFESEINDNNAKIENINTELKILKKELTKLDREKGNLELQVDTLNKNLKDSTGISEKLIIKKDNVQRRLEDLSKERENLTKKIEGSEEEYEKNTKDITGILQILNMLTQNINISVESIKSNIQLSNAEAIESSAEDFKKFVLDIVDIMKTVESIGVDEEKHAEMTEMISSIMQTLKMFTDNADETINQLIDKVKESADVEVQTSTSTFDSFVQDLMEILENVYLSLRKLTMSKSQELYKQLEEISESIKSQTYDFNKIEKQLTESSIQEKHYSENLSAYNKRLEEINKRNAELGERIKKGEEEINEREEIISNRQLEIENLDNQIKQLKENKDTYWENISTINEEIDNKQKELDNLRENLQELHGIQNLFDNITELDENVEKLNNTIGEKKNLIITTEENIKNIKAEQDSLQKNIDELVLQKEKFWEVTGNLRKQIDDENKTLEDTLDRLRALENVMRIINSIEDIKKENSEADNKIKTCSNEIEGLNSQIEEIQKNVDQKQEIINSLRKEKTEELESQKAAQKKLNRLNKDLQKAQGKLNELNKNKEREQKIIDLYGDIKDTNKQIESITTELSSFKEDLNKEDVKKNEKQKEIDKLTQEKDDSWKKQKQYQKIITDLKSDLSMENSKINNYESKKIMCTDQIETLFQRSKEYGSLPTVTAELSETGLQSDIVESTKKKKALEPVNLKAIEQYDAVKERFDEIDMRRQTIQRERKSILDAIDKIELEKTRTFMKAYHEINREFSRIFQKLSPGGSAKMILDRPDKPFEGGISIEARPRGKKISSLEILSGGEKTLVALSFIFAVQEFYPAPFYVMDEIDAALDGPNVHRVSMVIKEFASQAQFMVISHREENIVNSDRIYGVSMQQSGITDIFSVDLEEEAKRLLELEDIEPTITE
ncbi:MAG: chromosome segregation protein SMC [Promethearchaeota archaeon]|nr:MAG: chromosome segregation protein SMC [Candidatus Lokiarchaeota archaeon]